MWVVAIFDFPRYCKSGRQNMLLFTKHLEKEGFSKIQKGMYVRYCSTAANARVHKNKIISSIVEISLIISLINPFVFSLHYTFTCSTEVNSPA